MADGRLGKAPLDELIAAILNDHGFTDFDVSTVDGEVGGYLVTGPGSARGELEDLLRLGNIGVRSSGGRLVFFSQRDWRRPTWAGALVDDEDRPLIEIRRREASEIPQEFVVGFNDAARDYEGGSVGAAMAAASPARIERLDLPVTLDETEARRFAEGLLAESLGGRETASFAVSPTELHWEPGDRIELGAASGIWRITRIEDGVSRRIEAGRLPSPVRESADDRSERPVPGGGPALASRPKVEFLDLPDLAGRGDARIAVFARPWIPYELLAAPGETGFKARGVLQRPATMGELAEALAPGPEAVIDRGNDILVDLYSGELTSISATALLAGANLAAVRSSSGAWEVIQFEAAEEVGAMRFRLTNLVRALGGTDDAMRAGAPAGSSFVLLDSACVPVPLEPSEVGLALNWRVVPAGRALDDPATHVATAVLGLRAEQPLSPVHLRADFASDGGFALRWTRRGRIGADRWDGLEIPLGEEIERYAIRVTGEGATIERETGDPALVLSAAEQLSAFGSLPANLDVEICQLSLTAGRGTPRRHAFNRP